MSTDKKIYLIAGASRGIGLAIAKKLAFEGHQVIACCRHPQWAEGSKTLAHAGVDVRALDILSDDSINNLYVDLSNDYPYIDTLINCIGILHEKKIQPEKKLEQIRRSALQRVFDINSFGHILLIQALEPLLAKSSQFSCISISARVGSIADNKTGGWYSYRASKTALNMLLKTLAIEFERKYSSKPLVLSLHPGTTDTDLSKPFQKNIPWKLFSTSESAENLLRVIQRSTTSGEFMAYDGSIIPF
jgi:NAD(P)-dependent dehydrogenase (short-subunit alcohol dehydrogenase family)